jgi:hypothetical protein
MGKLPKLTIKTEQKTITETLDECGIKVRTIKTFSTISIAENISEETIQDYIQLEPFDYYPEEEEEVNALPLKTN